MEICTTRDHTRTTCNFERTLSSVSVTLHWEVIRLQLPPYMRIQLMFPKAMWNLLLSHSLMTGTLQLLASWFLSVVCLVREEGTHTPYTGRESSCESDSFSQNGAFTKALPVEKHTHKKHWGVLTVVIVMHHDSKRWLHRWRSHWRQHREQCFLCFFRSASSIPVYLSST